MALLFIDGFGQFQGQTGSRLLASLTSAGYGVSPGIGLAAGRHEGSFALELQVSAGAAGTSWSTRVNGIKVRLNAAAVGNNRWVAVGDNGVIYASADTINWSPCVNASPAHLYGVAYGDGLWVAVGANSTILTSTDTLSWVPATAPAAGATLRAVAFGEGTWVAAGDQGGVGAIFVSSDEADTWGSASGAGAAANAAVIHHVDFGWLAGGTAGQLLHSIDALSWTARTYGATGNIAAFAYDGTKLAAVAGGAFRASTDLGVTWAPSALISGRTFTGLAQAGGLWVAVGTSGSVYTSTDLVDWSARTTGTVAELRAVAVNATGQVAWVAVGAVVGAPPNNMAAIVVSMAPATTIRRTFTSAANRVVLGFAHRATSRGRILSIADVCDLNWPAGIELLGVLGNAVPIRNAWYYYELTIDKLAETITLHINDTLDITVPMPPAAATMTEYVVTWQVENGATGRINDIYWLDSSTTGGAELIERLKPVRIPLRLPTADEQIEWALTEEGADHWTVVGVPPPDTTRYAFSSTSGAQELFTSDDPLPEGAGTPEMRILAVGLVALASKSDLDNRQLGMVVGAGASQEEVVETEMTIDPKYSYAIFEKAPGNVAWDAANVAATPFGVVVRP